MATNIEPDAELPLAAGFDGISIKFIQGFWYVLIGSIAVVVASCGQLRLVWNEPES